MVSSDVVVAAEVAAMAYVEAAFPVVGLTACPVMAYPAAVVVVAAAAVVVAQSCSEG